MTIDEIIEKALEEDLGDGDHTSLSTIPEGKTGRAQLKIKQQGVIAGTQIAEKVFQKVDPSIHFDLKIEDGSQVQVGDIVFFIEGPSRSIL